jgi:hypothetical protein
MRRYLVSRQRFCDAITTTEEDVPRRAVVANVNHLRKVKKLLKTLAKYWQILVTHILTTGKYIREVHTFYMA